MHLQNRMKMPSHATCPHEKCAHTGKKTTAARRKKTGLEKIEQGKTTEPHERKNKRGENRLGNKTQNRSNEKNRRGEKSKPDMTCHMPSRGRAREWSDRVRAGCLGME
jgi:hypothetical protein